MTERGTNKSLLGTVVGNKMDKTALVRVERLTKHQVYGKYIKRNKKYMAHDPANTCQVGDRVRITESRPLSKLKRWRVSEIVVKANIED